MIAEFLKQYLALGISVATFVFFAIKFSRESKDRAKDAADKASREKHDAELKGAEEGYKRACEEKMKQSLDSAHDKIRTIEASLVHEKQRQSEQFIEVNAKLDNLMSIMSRFENDVVKRLDKLEDEP